jgi:hypothetical protein
MSRLGPCLSIVASCAGCAHDRLERYDERPNSGINRYCHEPSVVAANAGRRFHDGSGTPAWCPLLDDATARLGDAAARAVCEQLLAALKLATLTSAGHRDAHMAYQRWAAVHAPDAVGDEAKRAVIDGLIRGRK